LVPNAKIALYFDDTTNISDSWVDPFVAAIGDNVNQPSVISLSWSFPEPFLDSLPNLLDIFYDTVIAPAAIKGITICCSVGDLGATSGKGALDNRLTIRFPAATDGVLAVGGTTLVLNQDDTRYSEEAWVGSGGGLSEKTGIPTWQQGLRYKEYNSGEVFSLFTRGIPDVTANANPSSGYTFYFYNSDSQTNLQISAGGTSASTPLVAALILRLNQIFDTRLGFVNKLFYQNISAFNDVTIGNNYRNVNGFVASSGWDAVSGLGSPNGQLLVDALLEIPIAGNLSVTVAQNSSATITPSVSVGVTEISITNPPDHGTATVSAGRFDIIYTPSNDYYGTDSFQYIVKTRFAQSAPALVSITVGSLAPIANTLTVTVVANSEVAVISPNVTNYYSSIGVVTTENTQGRALTDGASIFYTPLTNFVGTDTFQYYAVSPSGNSNNADVIVTVPKPAAPIAKNISKYVLYNSVNNIIKPNIENIYSSITTPEFSVNSGTVSVINNTILYSTPIDYSGNDRFDYTAIGPGGTSTASVRISILQSTSSNIAFNISQFVKQNSTDNLIKLSDTNSIGTLTVVVRALHGTSTVTNNLVYYTPNVNYVGFDHFEYYISNAVGDSNVASINISVNSLDYVPQVFKSTASVFQGSSNNILRPLVSNTVTGIILNSKPLFGVASASTSTITYSPNSRFVGIDYFYYSAFNSAGISKSERFYVTVNPVLTPYANPVNVTVAYNSVNNPITPSVINPFNTATVVTSPLHGVATVSNIVIYYTPTTGYSGTDTFDYSVGNLKGVSNSAPVNVTVLPSVGMLIYPPSGNLPSGSTGTVYEPVTFYGINGTAPFSSSISSGTLPEGLTLVNNVLSGTPGPHTERLYRFSVTLQDSSFPNNLIVTGTYVLSISSDVNTTITAISFNELESASTNLVSDTYGSFNTSAQVIPGNLVTELGWNQIYNDMLRCFIHQNGPSSTDMGFVRPTTGTYVSLGQLKAMLGRMEVLTTSYLDAHPTQILLDTDSTLSLTTATLVDKTFNVSYSWQNPEDPLYFFNLGGSLKGTIYNSSTNVEMSAIFTLSNYVNNVPASISGTNAVISGVGTINITNLAGDPGDTVIASFEISTSSNVIPAEMSFTATYYYSTDKTGGVLAPRPLVQFTGGVITASAIGNVVVTGNDPKIISVNITNGSDETVTIPVPTEFVNSFKVSENTSPLTVTALNLPLTIPPNSTGILQIKLQNFTAIGGRYPIIFKIRGYTGSEPDLVLLNSIVLRGTLTVKFGITVDPSIVTATVTEPRNFDFKITGYGGYLSSAELVGDNFTTVNTGSVSYVNFDGVTPLFSTSTLLFETLYVINGPYSGSLIAYGRTDEDTPETSSTSVTLDLTLDVEDRNLGFNPNVAGSWISAQAPYNVVVGFDYSIFNGQRFLTTGFGSNPVLSNGGYPTYSNFSLKSLGRPKYNTNFRYFRSSYPGWGTFLKTHGMATTSPAGTTESGNSVFFVRYGGSFQWQFAASSQGSLVIDGQTVINQATDSTISYQGNITLTAGTHTVAWSHIGAVGSTITYLDGKNKDYNAWSTLDECYYNSWYEITRLRILLDFNNISYTMEPNIYPPKDAKISGNVFTYSENFTSPSGEKGMFLVSNDGSGNLIISANRLTTVTAESKEIDTTLRVVENELFYYYSAVSNRYNNIGSVVNFDGSTETPVFIGFDSSGNVLTRLLPELLGPPQVRPIPRYPDRRINIWPIIAAGVAIYLRVTAVVPVPIPITPLAPWPS